MVKPSLRLERELLRAGHGLVAGVDEVGRGALAGPVTVGVVVVDAGVPTAPAGLRDSKLLTPAARHQLEPKLQRWARAWAVGHARADEIDRIGIVSALRLAASRALGQLPVRPDIVVLDGNHNYLSPGKAPDAGAVMFPGDCDIPPSLTRIKADQTCSAVAAASVLAKCQRDRLMVDLHTSHPQYCWDRNKGYAAPDHQAALAAHGPCELHRLSWRLAACRPDDSTQMLLDL